MEVPERPLTFPEYMALYFFTALHGLLFLLAFIIVFPAACLITGVIDGARKAIETVNSHR